MAAATEAREVPAIKVVMAAATETREVPAIKVVRTRYCMIASMLTVRTKGILGICNLPPYQSEDSLLSAAPPARSLLEGGFRMCIFPFHFRFGANSALKRTTRNTKYISSNERSNSMLKIFLLRFLQVQEHLFHKWFNLAVHWGTVKDEKSIQKDLEIIKENGTLVTFESSTYAERLQRENNDIVSYEPSGDGVPENSKSKKTTTGTKKKQNKIRQKKNLDFEEGYVAKV
ncbi:OLC1v1019585C1 [Oldenlandia corymbosa var. corymbosa]|uniref:OLC1v1019585C1 n=1 Tax=Oldenlandia corymbosa var. corymbosa TaxID=529605 RepID=A0AAV1EE92_OLDCO|nr:OLC1v1019585C1 [Oldenlandia corymbosa var. corymbosa]